MVFRGLRRVVQMWHQVSQANHRSGKEAPTDDALVERPTVLSVVK